MPATILIINKSTFVAYRGKEIEILYVFYKSFDKPTSICLVTTTDLLRSNQERRCVLRNHQCQPFVCRNGLSICSTPSTGATVITEVPRATMRPRVRSFPLRRYGSLASGESTKKKEGWKFSHRYSQGIEWNGISSVYIKVSTNTP